MRMAKIWGALSNALIIVSLFIPFISYDAFNQSLWGLYKLQGCEYITYVVIVSSIISILLFAINKKCELSYFNGGIVMFLILREIMDIVKENTLNMLGIGFYGIIIGEILLLVTTFLSCKKEVKYE